MIKVGDIIRHPYKDKPYHLYLLLALNVNNISYVFDLNRLIFFGINTKFLEKEKFISI